MTGVTGEPSGFQSNGFQPVHGSIFPELPTGSSDRWISIVVFKTKPRLPANEILADETAPRALSDQWNQATDTDQIVERRNDW